MVPIDSTVLWSICRTRVEIDSGQTIMTSLINFEGLRKGRSVSGIRFKERETTGSMAVNDCSGIGLGAISSK